MKVAAMRHEMKVNTLGGCVLTLEVIPSNTIKELKTMLLNEKTCEDRKYLEVQVLPCTKRSGHSGTWKTGAPGEGMGGGVVGVGGRSGAGGGNLSLPIMQRNFEITRVEPPSECYATWLAEIC